MQNITSAPDKVVKDERNTTPNLHANILFFFFFYDAIHSHKDKHACAHKLKKALLQRQIGSGIDPVLLDLVHSLTEKCGCSQSLCGLLGSLGVALHAQDLSVQWITAVFIRLNGERASTVLRGEHHKQVLVFCRIWFYLENVGS